MKTKSKNNVENRGKQTKPRIYNGKIVKPVLFVSPKGRYMAALYEDDTMAINPFTGNPLAYKDAERQD